MSDDAVVSLSREELRGMVAELMEEYLREMRPSSALVKDVGGKPMLEVKEYAHSAAEAVTLAVAAYRAGKDSL